MLCDQAVGQLEVPSAATAEARQQQVRCTHALGLQGGEGCQEEEAERWCEGQRGSTV